MSEFLPYARHAIFPEDHAAVERVLKSDYLTQGPEVEAFEHEFAKVCGAKYCVAVSSGTAALHLAYLACGVGPDTTVLTTPISFVATANAALYCGAELQFYDIKSANPWSLCQKMRPSIWERIWGKGKRTAFFVPVTLGGTTGNQFWHWSKDNGGRIIADMCHGPFTIPSGTIPECNVDAACFSLHAAKHVAAGEGGAVVTNNSFIATQGHELRNHGRALVEYDNDGSPWKSYNPAKATPFHHMTELGFNYRMPELSGALARSQLTRLDWNITQRRRLAARYDEAFYGKQRPVPHGPDSARHLYQILVEDRDETMAKLREAGIGTQVHYRPIHLEPYWRLTFGYKPGDFPNAEYFGDHALTIPLFPTLTDAQQDHVIKETNRICVPAAD